MPKYLIIGPRQTLHSTSPTTKPSAATAVPARSISAPADDELGVAPVLVAAPAPAGADDIVADPVVSEADEDVTDATDMTGVTETVLELPELVLVDLPGVTVDESVSSSTGAVYSPVKILPLPPSSSV